MICNLAETERDGSITATTGCGNDDCGKFLPEFADVKGARPDGIVSRIQ